MDADTTRTISDDAPIEAPPRSAPLWWIVLILAVGVLTGAALLLGESARDGLTASAPATALGIATLCYLAAAATGIRWMAWLWAGLGTLLVVGAELLDVPRWIALGAVAVGFAAYGLVRRPRITAPQAIALVGYFGAAVIAIAIEPRVGLALAGLALAAHAVWDVIHYRRDIVVNRSLALWCIGLDLLLGGASVVVAIAG